MSIVEATKTALATAGNLAELAKKVGDIDLYKQIVEFQGQVVSLSGLVYTMNADLLEAKREVQRLKEHQEVAKKVTPKEDAVIVDGNDRPHCIKCWYADKLLMPLVDAINGGRCPKCDKTFRLSYFGTPYNPSPGRGRAASDFDPFSHDE